MAKIGFLGQKPKFLAQKKGFTFGDLPCSGHDRKKLFKEKSTLFQNKHQTLKKFSHWFTDRGYQKFYSMPPKMNFWLKNGHIWPNIGFFGPFDPMPLKKEMWTSCPGGFSVMWVQKLLLPPVRIRIFGLKTAKFGPKLAFWAKYRHFWPI